MDADWTILPRADVYEVGASKLDWSSVRDLPDAGFRKLTSAQASGYTGDYYQCPSGKTPYLIRAVYCNPGLGRFRAERKGNSLAIVWGGSIHSGSKVYERTAVIVNLDFTPDEIYTNVSVGL